MATRALDVITILHALSVLNKELEIKTWNAKNSQQKKIFDWLEEHRELLAKVTGLDAKASRFYEELNRFLTDHKFSPMVKPFDPNQGLGVVSILDKLVKWLHGPGTKVQILTARGERPGFELPAQGVNIFKVNGYPDSYLLELLTGSNDTLWLFDHDDTTLDGLAVVELSMNVMSRSREIPTRNSRFSDRCPVFAGAQFPMLDFDIKPDISWMTGADTHASGGGYFYIAQAAQQYKMRMDETGARVKVATTMAVMRGISEKPQIFVIDRPFYGWWTQKGLNLPMAAFFADYDSFRKPDGSLENL
jgi:hypothetical protein